MTSIGYPSSAQFRFVEPVSQPVKVEFSQIAARLIVTHQERNMVSFWGSFRGSIALGLEVGRYCSYVARNNT
jgi:hypothetical protein